jgi:crossover junction endodeoxyribonuclease RusA
MRKPEQPIVAFEVLGEPVPKGRPRVTKTGRAYTPKRTLEAEAMVQGYFREKYPGAVTSLYQEFRVELTFFRKSRRKTDLDNLGKLVLDALNKLVWEDDHQITKLVLEMVRVTKDPKTRVAVYLR